MKKRLFPAIIIAIIIICTLSLNLGPAASAFTPSSFEVHAQAALLISSDGNSVIYEKNADERIYPASLVKVMTAVLVIENSTDLENEKITATAAVLNSLKGQSYDAYKIKVGEDIPAIDLVYLMTLASSNEASVIAAEYFGGGSNSKFIKMMNAKAADLGMNDTVFTNATGFHDEGQYTTARDMFKLVKHAMELDVFKTVANTRMYEMKATNLTSSSRYVLTNNWLRDSATNYYYRYATGAKTGMTEEAGRCLAATATKDKKNYICILMGSPVTDQDGKDVRYEFTDAKNLFEWAFNDFTRKQVLGTSEPVGEAKVLYSWDTDYVTLYPAQDLTSTIPATSDTSTVVTEVFLSKEEFEAPVTQGEVLGYAVVKYAGVELGRVDLLASESVERNFFLAAVGEVKKAAGTTWFKIILLVIAAFIVFRIISSSVRRRKRKNTKKVKDYRRM